MKNKYKDLLRKDYFRYNNKPDRYVKVFLRLFRKIQYSSLVFIKKIYQIRFYCLSRKRGIEISSSCVIGGGLYLGHFWNVTINHDVKIGNNVNLHKGVTIGQENRGKRKGCPTIGNNVWIGVNATIVGRITIGDDVLVAPNSFVNFDVPSHSVVFGNPGKVIHKDKATIGYINNI